MTERIQCSGYDRIVSSELLERYREHYADKSEAYCRSNRGHVQKRLTGPVFGTVNESKLCELHMINERLAAIQADVQAARQERAE